MTAHNRQLLIALGAGAFGGFYSFLVDLATLVPGASNLSGASLVALRAGLTALVAAFAYLAIRVLPAASTLVARRAGFLRIDERWFPQAVERRIEVSRRVFTELVCEPSWPLYLASVTGEWDICRPFGEKELKEIFSSRSATARVLLAHPGSPALAQRCAAEGADLLAMMRRIVHNSQYLSNAGGGRVDVRWYLDPPLFHVFGNARVMHFTPFLEGVQGHDTPRYVVDSESGLYKSYREWFDWTWERALPVAQELHWARKGSLPRRAVFLDRDDTLIKDVAYFSDAASTEVEVLPTVVEGLRVLRNAGYRLIVVSNQHPVAMRITSPQELVKLTKKIKQRFSREGVPIDAFYYCTHGEAEGCGCRKPRPQLFERAAHDFHLNLANCHFIGDSEADAGVAAYLPQLDVQLVGGRTFLEVAQGIVAEHSIERGR